ncbi:DUF3219 family protein [Oceanobacillus profundus]|uniref:DUF3219 family protein n=1 Tax=Oceanobacillus profundus TaxID=372463 RepID=A0A417YHX0_9BACI|nr:DUF3219 family protein [Oceanobacillus profundus]MBR3121456.1 DUF3219 family protein [Oceanobacillus sp.]PAE28256.1 hypothetical protein CHI07_15855 [Paenibacillus sp. 7884-2]MCM3399706.1 YkvR family protein [Oceanobacillus profundus]MDO6450043.1 DUF3219 family protein [Oceanobacillus profundus]RHW32518.1 DUF3219 family protein [Oceanobacillus profundus]
MKRKVIINGYEIDGLEFQMETLPKGNRKVSFAFKVSSEEYHDITTLLYKNDFTLQIPEENLELQATIHNYATSITNLYEANAVGDFHLELVEKQ